MDDVQSLLKEIEGLKKELEISKGTIKCLTDQLSSQSYHNLHYGISSFSSANQGILKIQGALSIIICGASGELAKKKTFPTLYALYKAGLLPSPTQIVGFARTTMGDDQSFREHLSTYVNVQGEEKLIWHDFLNCCSYIKSHSYGDTNAWQLVNQKLYEFEKAGYLIWIWE